MEEVLDVGGIRSAKLTDLALSGTPEIVGQRNLMRLALTSMLGTSIEFYDFFIFATASAIIFPTVFFSKSTPPLVALIWSFSTFAIGFFARPVGGALFGHFGDKLGRKRMLVLAMLMMGVATTLIGVLPPYSAIGVAAPVLLILLRLVQGFALGGQWGGAVLIILEDAPAKTRGLYGAFAQVGAPAGAILANLAFMTVSAWTSKAAFLAWAWRIPFLVSVVLIAVSLFVQMRLEDTLTFARQKQGAPARRGSPLLQALRGHLTTILLAAGTFVGMQTSYYLLASFSLVYGSSPHGGGMATHDILTAVLLGAAAMAPGVFGGAWLSDRVGRRAVVGVSAALLAAWSFAEFPLIGHGTLASASLAICVGQLLTGAIFGPLAALYAECFPTEVRYSGLSLAYQIGTLAGGALAPLIATALLGHFGGALPISIYAAGMCVISVLAAWKIRETAGSPLDPESLP
jgi:MFS family permease